MMKRMPLPRPIPENIKQVFQMLLQVNEEQRVGGVLRVAGGWVRDQMLMVDSNDIDITIETPQHIMDEKGSFITGSQFAHEIKAFNERHNIPGNTISVIKTNPEKSKHIETAQLTVQGIPLEFCHLRTDEYTQDSRVPVVRPGSPLEDAMRRDFTVNALFYNLHSEEVEDYTGCGFEDMEAKVLRTPLQPRETFLDDPLRLLRGIRFAGQLGYDLHQDVINAADDEEVLDCLMKKVARERFGIEVSKMFKGNSPTLCIKYMTDLGLLQRSIILEAVMNKKKKGEIDRIVPVLPQQTCEELDAVLNGVRHTGVELYNKLAAADSPLSIPKGQDRFVASMFFLTVPIYGTVSHTERLDRLPALSTNGLKLPGGVADTVNKLITAYQALLPHIGSIRDIALTTSGPSENMIFTGAEREAIFVALQQAAMKNVPPCALGCSIAAAMANIGADDNVAADLGAILNCIESDANGKLKASATRPAVLKGQDIPDALGVEKKQTGHYLAAQMKFLLHNPDANKDEVVAHLKTVAPL